MSLNPSRVWKVFSTNVDEGVYVAADDERLARMKALMILRLTSPSLEADDLIARYIITSANPARFIQQLRERTQS